MDPCLAADAPPECFELEPSGPACGDGEINQDGEACDDGTVNSSPEGCDLEAANTASGVGRGLRRRQRRLRGLPPRRSMREQTDRASVRRGVHDGCTAECQLGPFCGDAAKNGTEPCDDGAGNDTGGYGKCSAAAPSGVTVAMER